MRRRPEGRGRTTNAVTTTTNTKNTASAAAAGAAAALLPTSGSERPFTVTTFGTARGKGNNNCYAWAIDKYRNDGGVKLQPGNLSGARDPLNLSSCGAVMSRASSAWSISSLVI